MQDTKNLQNKIDKFYPKLIREAKAKGDHYTADYWQREIENLKAKIEMRNKNRKKNEKQRRKYN